MARITQICEGDYTSIQKMAWRYVSIWAKQAEKI